MELAVMSDLEGAAEELLALEAQALPVLPAEMVATQQFKDQYKVIHWVVEEGKGVMDVLARILVLVNQGTMLSLVAEAEGERLWVVVQERGVVHFLLQEEGVLMV